MKLLVLMLAIVLFPTRAWASCGTLYMSIFQQLEAAEHVALLGPNREMVRLIKGEDVWQNLYEAPPPRRRHGRRVIDFSAGCELSQFDEQELALGGLFFATAERKPVNRFAGSTGILATPTDVAYPALRTAADVTRAAELLSTWLEADSERRRRLLIELASEGGWIGHEALQHLGVEPAMIAALTRQDLHSLLGAASRIPIGRGRYSTMRVFIRAHDPIAIPWLMQSSSTLSRIGYDVGEHGPSLELLGLSPESENVSALVARETAELADRVALLERIRQRLEVADLEPPSLAQVIRRGEGWQRHLALDLCEQHHGRPLSAGPPPRERATLFFAESYYLDSGPDYEPVFLNDEYLEKLAGVCVSGESLPPEASEAP